MQVSFHRPEELVTLRQLVRKESNAKQRDRYRAVLLALEGLSEPEIRLRLSRSRGFIQRWVYAYRDNGIGGLRAKKPTGANLPSCPATEKRNSRSCWTSPVGHDVVGTWRTFCKNASV